MRAAVLLPGVVTIAVPAVILAAGGTHVGWGAWPVLTVVAGALVIVAGAALWVATVKLFAREGKGTLAPWDPTQKLVVRGPYRYVRNPMITGVLTVLGGEALVFGSPGILVLAAGFFVANLVWFPLVEEPGLRRRFGDDYEHYRANVPRWIPRRTPWSQG